MAQRFGIGEATVYKWKKRYSFQDASHTSRLCQTLGIEHRLTKPRTPKTNGMVERFNGPGRIADVLTTHRFINGEDLEQTLLRYVALYNHQLPQSTLKSKTPSRP